MLADKRVLAVVPARGGSKRLPRKNLLSLGGKPLIAWTLEAALRSHYIDELVVSSDDKEVIDVAIRWGAHAPFKRPAGISGDLATTNVVVEHCLDYYAGLGKQFDLVMILQPTSPLRTVDHIDGAFERYLSAGVKGLISVCECEHSPLWANTLPPDLSMANFLSADILGVRSQDLGTYYRLNGAIYLFAVDTFLEAGGIFYAPDVIAQPMDQYSSVDIDTELDLKFAELLLNERRSA
jgi:CMP-N-acetylneuraminic acid synthetase